MGHVDSTVTFTMKGKRFVCESFNILAVFEGHRDEITDGTGAVVQTGGDFVAVTIENAGTIEVDQTLEEAVLLWQGDHGQFTGTSTK